MAYVPKINPLMGNVPPPAPAAPSRYSPKANVLMDPGLDPKDYAVKHAPPPKPDIAGKSYTQSAVDSVLKQTQSALGRKSGVPAVPQMTAPTNYVNPLTSGDFWGSLAQHAANKIPELLPGVKQIGDVSEQLTGARDAKSNLIDMLERSGKISHQQAIDTRQKLIDQFSWTGVKDDKGNTSYNVNPVENAKKAGGTAAQLVSETVPIPIFKAKTGASLISNLARGASQGGIAGAVHATGRGLSDKGQVNAQDVAEGAAMGGAAGGAFSLAGKATGKLVGRTKPSTIETPAVAPESALKPIATGRQGQAVTPGLSKQVTGRAQLPKDLTLASETVGKDSGLTISAAIPRAKQSLPEPTTTPISGIAKIGKPTVAGDAGSVVDRIKAKASDLYTKALDRYNPLVKLGKQAGQRDSIENALAGHYGAGSTATYHLDYQLKPVLKGVNADDFKNYLVAARDRELAGRNIKGSDAGAADQVMSNLEGKLGAQGVSDLRQRAGKLYDYQKNMVNTYLVKTGVMSHEAANAMFSNNKAYVPFKRIMDTVDQHLGMTPGNKVIATSQNVIKAIKGSDKQIIDPLQSIVENTYKMVSLGRQNEVGKALVDLRTKLGDDLIKPVSAKDATNKPTISVFENGKKQLYQVAPEVAESAKALNGQQMNTLVKILAGPTRVFRATATGANPEFALPNMTRDLQTAFVTAGLNPLKWVSGLTHYMKKDELYQKFLKSGGLTSRLSLDRPALTKTATELIGKRGISAANPKQLYHLLEKFGEASEVPTRIAAFKQELARQAKSGMTGPEAERAAARAAQEVSVNFARRGSATQSINAVYAFMNARAQGTDRLLRSFKANPVGVSARLGLITVAPAAALYTYNSQFPGYNDPRIVSAMDKQNNFIIMAPWLGQGRYIKVPKGDVGKLANPVEAFMAYAHGQGGDTAAALGQALSAFSPANNIGDAVPTALRPGVEVAANKNFFTGQEIVPAYKQNYPASEQFKSNTPAIYQQIGKQLGVSPAQIQNVMQGYLTGYARIGESAANPLMPKSTQSAQASHQGADSINNTPIIRRFLGGAKQSPQEYATSLSKQINSIDFNKKDLKSGLNRGEITPAQYKQQFQVLDNQQQKIKDDAVKGGYGDLLQQIATQNNKQRAQKAAQTRANKP